MAHLVKIRKGWENENLASFLLSKFSFISKPFTIADDIGTDFYCTLFKVETKGNNKFLLPTNSFSIQIKSNYKKINITKKIGYLSNLEIPFFIGVINQKELKLTIFSGEYLSQFISFRTPNILLAELCDRQKMQSYYKDLGNKKFILKFPKVAEIKADITQEELQENVNEIFKVNSITLNNISSRKNCEYIFYQYENNYIQINAGPSSIKTFRENFYKRLTENFTNLKWMFERNHPDFNIKEFQVYENLLIQLKKINSNIPNYVFDSYKELKGKLNTKAKV